MSNDINISYYKNINHVSEAPPDSILIYNMAGTNGGIGYVNRKDYNLFCKYYIEANSFSKHHTMDLAFAKYHSLVLDIDFKGYFTNMDISNYMSVYLKPTLKSLFDELPCFTFISATRPHGGLHIHLCELLISHDDYIQFCKQLQHRMNVKFQTYEVNVDIPINFTLSTASKPGVMPYKPFNIWFIDPTTDICLPLSDNASYMREHKKMKFKKRKSNSNSIFRKLIVFPYEQIMKEVLNCMMPYVVFTGIEPIKITYQTIISSEMVTEYQQICDISYENGYFYVFKSNKLNFKALDWLSVYNYFNNQCCRIKMIDTENYALTYWLKSMKTSIVTQKDIFQKINQMIKDDSGYWRNDPHPLRTIMKHHEGLYFLPVFYALCKLIDKSPHNILNYFTGICMDKLINRLKLIDEKLLKDVAEKFTKETILYCASNVRINDSTDDVQDKIDCVIEDTKETVLLCRSKLDFQDIIRKIIKRYTPIVIGTYQHSSKKSARLLWNVWIEHWQEITIDDFINHVQVINNRIEYFFEKNKKCTNIFTKLQINTFARCLYGVANLERKEIAMDQHKFHLKTRAGILDLLTGHVGATVPEFFMSNKSINIDFSRYELNHLYDDPELIQIYQLITSKTFFRKFLKYALTDVSDDYFDIIKIVSEEYGMNPDSKYLDSVLNFYCHLCKYMSFEYDMVIYMLYIISSIFIATNYYRHFFIFQGNTKNGKSKFFELIDKVFGSYCHSIRSINLQSSKNSSGPQPELATSLHSCRIISVEELASKIDENLIKILTGNSQVNCRMLYETHAGGIPTAKVFASTNNPPECTATEAFKERVLAIPFASSFSENAPLSISQQIMDNVYKIDLSDNVVRNSFVGMFILAYCNLVQNFDHETGLVNLPPTPVMMTEFKEDYLKMTDIFAQFKQYADLQIIPDTKLLYTDLVSAVRKFLINTKNHLSLESIILKRFDEEFFNYKQETDFGEDFNSPPEDNDEEDVMDEEDEDDNNKEDIINDVCYSTEPVRKKLKMTIIYYENVSIKQLKKRFM